MKNLVKIFLFLWLCGILVYFNSLNNKFMLDDYAFLSSPLLSSTKFIPYQWNPYQEQMFGVDNKVSQLHYYRPMQHMVLALCYDLFKKNYWQYHLLNIFLFVSASFLIYLVIEKFFGNSLLALLTSLFFLIHPINGVIVNYISANVFAFQLIFVLSAILLLWESLERQDNRLLYFLSLFFSAFSLLWHESAIMLPFYIAAPVLLLRKDPFKKKAFYLFPYFLIVFFYFIFRFFFLSVDTGFLKSIPSHLTLWAYLGNLFTITIWYIPKLFYPQGIVFMWVAPLLNSHVFLAAVGMVLMILLFLCLFVRYLRQKVVCMALAWILTGFAPLCLAAFIRYGMVEIEPHWLIISSMGFFILSAAFCSFVMDRNRLGGAVLIFIMLFIWGAFSHANNRVWADQKTYALYWAKQDPGFKFIYSVLGSSYRWEGNSQEARKYYQLALSDEAYNDAGIYESLGFLDQKEGHLKEAIVDYELSVYLYPNFADAYDSLGSIYFAQGRFNDAKECFRRALVFNPLLKQPRIELASIFLKEAKYSIAVKLCTKNLAIFKDDPETTLLLINIFLKIKDEENIRKYASHAIQVFVDSKSLTNLGIFMMNNYPFIAMSCFEKVIRMDPGYSDAYLVSGALFADLGKYDDAIKLWKIGLSVAPADQRFKKYIAQITALKNDGQMGQKAAVKSAL